MVHQGWQQTAAFGTRVSRLMAARSRPHYATPGCSIVVVVFLLGARASGFIVGPPRTNVWPSIDHVNHVSSQKTRDTSATSRLVPSPLRTCCNVVAASPATEDLASEEVEILIWDPPDQLVDEFAFNSEFLTVEEGEGAKRLDAFLVGRIPEQSRSYFGGLCQLGMVLVDGKAAKKSMKVEEGQEVEVRFVINPELSLEGEDIPLDIIFEDDDIIAVNKPPGMVVHPAPGSWNGTFVNALVYHLEKATGGTHQAAGFEPRMDVSDGEHNPGLRPGIVHRLDKGTTGVLLAAKNSAMQAKLADIFAKRRVSKSYLAVCVGNPGVGATIDVPIGRHPTHRQKMVAVPTIQPNIRARRAVSVVTTAAFDGKLSVADVSIETGRTHQIRVHLQHRRTPVLGDDVYGNKDWNRRLQQSTGMTRPLLHAHSLEFKHPSTGEVVYLVAPLPNDVESVVRRIYPQVEDEHPDWLASGRIIGDETALERMEEKEEGLPEGFEVPEGLRDYRIF